MSIHFLWFLYPATGGAVLTECYGQKNICDVFYQIKISQRSLISQVSILLAQCLVPLGSR